MRRATIIGATGFIGSALRARLEQRGVAVRAPGRGEPPAPEVGDLFYCAGLTADFRERPYDTIEAHVTLLARVLAEVPFDSLTYLSSTRVYQRSDEGREDGPLTVRPSDPGDIYNLSKLTGEALCLADSRSTVRVLRLSNVFGAGGRSDNFLDMVVREALTTGHVHIRAGAEAAKDYLALDNAISAIERTPQRARSRIINVASGTRVSNAAIARILGERFGVTTTFAENVVGSAFPEIEIARMQEELGVEPGSFEPAFVRFAAALQ